MILNTRSRSTFHVRSGKGTRELKWPGAKKGLLGHLNRLGFGSRFVFALQMGPGSNDPDSRGQLVGGLPQQLVLLKRSLSQDTFQLVKSAGWWGVVTLARGRRLGRRARGC